ncbi:unnamed protein product [Choristocarpus tenellus]
MYKVLLEGSGDEQDVYDIEGGVSEMLPTYPTHPSKLVNAFNQILKGTEGPGGHHHVGDHEVGTGGTIPTAIHQPRAPLDMCLLTTMRRDEWADARCRLVRLSRDNVSHLQDVESALFILSLDEREAGADRAMGGNGGAEMNSTETARLTLLGGGRGRWHDKPFTLVVYKDGTPALNGEHSFADALPVMQAFHHAVAFAQNMVGPLMAAVVEGGGAGITDGSLARTEDRMHNPFSARISEELVWTMDDVVNASVFKAAKEAELLCQGFDLQVVHFRMFGRRALKELGVGADAFFQMAIQMAAWRVFGRPVAVYETAHTRRFYLGRTECSRPCSSESLAFVKAVHDPLTGAAVQHKLLLQALGRHSAFSKRCMAGEGIDRHMFGLELAWMEDMKAQAGGMVEIERNGKARTPLIFTHPLHLRAKAFSVSTSQTSPSNIWACYTPSEGDGFGCCYTIADDVITAAISSVVATRSAVGDMCEGGSPTDAKGFGVELKSALQELFHLCLSQFPGGRGGGGSAAQNIDCVPSSRL